MPTWGAIFDWDGVIVNTSDLHKKSWEWLAIELNQKLPLDHFDKGFGKRNETIIPEILQWSSDPKLIDQWGKRKEEIYRQLGQDGGIRLAKGARAFLISLSDWDIKCAIGTSTEYANVKLALEQHSLSEFFEGAACSEDVSKGKPDPEVFLIAAEKLNLSPDKCVVFEDSPHGILAGKKAEMKTVALTTSHPADSFTSLSPDLIVDSLADLHPEQIATLFK